MSPKFDPLKFLSLAHELANQNEESNLRSAVNRAYYAVFLIAREKTGVTDRKGVHKKVVKKLRRRRGYWATAEKLRSLFRLRTVADYELLPANPSDRNWPHNWSTTQDLVDNILPKLQAL